MTTKSEIMKEYYSLSVAQRRYIFDDTYYAVNPKTEEVLVRKGYVFSYRERSRTMNNGILKLGSKFTEKAHKFVESYLNIKFKSNIAYQDGIVVNDINFLRSLITEGKLVDEEFYFDVYSGIGTTILNDVKYILHPHLKWKLEVDTSEIYCYKSKFNNKQYYLKFS
jgi:hypothetical protein